MKKYKRYIKLVICFLLLFIFIFICLRLLSKGYKNSYSLDNNKYQIEEVYTRDTDDEHDNYYIEIKSKDIIYNFQLYQNIKDNNKLVKEVLYYDGDYKCLLPILSNDVKVDFMCYKDSKYYDYANIRGLDYDLDKYINSLDKTKYNISDFKDDTSNMDKVDNINYNKKNIPNDYVVSMSTLKGIINLNSDNEKIDVFNKDKYKRDISLFYNNFYITADYNSNYSFRELYIVDINTNKKNVVKAPDYISFDSYIQGVVDNELYLYDISNEKQYKVNLDDFSIKVVGTKKTKIKYYDNKWTDISSVKANKKLLFNYDVTSDDEYEYIYKRGNKLSGFIYYLKKVNDEYEVYKANIQNQELKKYIFNVENSNDLIFIDDYVFFKDKDKIKLYNDSIGIKTVVVNNELEFNNNTLFNVYKKD